MPILKNGLIDVVILCGGKGRRLGALTKRTPKPLIPVGEFPFLVYLLRWFQRQGFQRFILAVGHLAGQFYDFAETYRSQFPQVAVVQEKVALGTGGALRHAAGEVASEIFVALNGDSFLPQPLAPVLQFHAERKSVFTMVAVRRDRIEMESHHMGGLQIGKNGELLRFRGYQADEEEWVSAGVYAANVDKILSWPSGVYNLENKLESLLEPDKPTLFKSNHSLVEIGTPKSLKMTREKYETDSLLFS